MKIGSLFAGIGGFDLAARSVGWETAWFSEIDPYASAVLKKHWPSVPNLGDITQIGSPPKVDLLCGGFPCQDISIAGQRAGIGGERSGLWKHYARLIGEIRPRWVVAENVSALRSRGLDTVLSDLATLGYDAEWHCVPASAVGAPHQRDRIWIVAYPNDNAGQGRAGSDSLFAGGWPYPAQLTDVQRARTSRSDHVGPGSAVVADAHDAGCGEQRGSVPASQEHQAFECGSWWRVEPNVGRVANGVPSRVDRLKCLGNAIVPQVAEVIFRAIGRAA